MYYIYLKFCKFFSFSQVTFDRMDLTNYLAVLLFNREDFMKALLLGPFLDSEHTQASLNINIISDTHNKAAVRLSHTQRKI